jgi:EpsI family protein
MPPKLFIFPKQINIRLVVCILFTSTLVAYFYWDGFTVLAQQWIRLEQYWVFLIAPVSVYFFWRERSKIASIPVRPSLWTGAAFVSAGGIAYVLWRISFIDLFIETGLFLLTIGLISLLLGKNFTKEFLLPIAYLLLMTSIFGRILAPIAEFMQHASAIATSFFLNTTGCEVMRDGLFLRLPTTVLKVASECSGVGQLTALVAFAVPLGIVMHKTLWPRLVLLGLAIPLALFVNIIRIILIALWNYHTLKTSFHGPHDILLMPFIYPLALILLYACSRYLVRFEKKTAPLSSQVPQTARERSAPSSQGAAWGVSCLLMILIMTGACFFRAQSAHSSYNLAEFPGSIGYWRSDRSSDSTFSFYMGKPDAMLQREYRNGAGATIRLFIARFDQQNIRNRISSLKRPHLSGPERDFDIVVNNAKTIRAAKAAVNESNRTFMTVSWFDVDGRTCRTMGEMRKMTFLNTLIKKRNNAAFIAMSFDNDPEGIDDSIVRSFAALTTPYIQKMLAITH